MTKTKIEFKGTIDGKLSFDISEACALKISKLLMADIKRQQKRGFSAPFP